MTTAGAFSPPPVPVRLMTRLPTVSCCQARPRSSAKLLSHLSTLHNHYCHNIYVLIFIFGSDYAAHTFLHMLQTFAPWQQASALLMGEVFLWND